SALPSCTLATAFKNDIVIASRRIAVTSVINKGGTDHASVNAASNQMALSLYRSVAWNCYDGVAAGGRFSGCSLTGRHQSCPCHRKTLGSGRRRIGSGSQPII